MNIESELNKRLTKTGIYSNHYSLKESINHLTGYIFLSEKWIYSYIVDKIAYQKNGNVYNDSSYVNSSSVFVDQSQELYRNKLGKLSILPRRLYTYSLLFISLSLFLYLVTVKIFDKWIWLEQIGINVNLFSICTIFGLGFMSLSFLLLPFKKITRVKYMNCLNIASQLFSVINPETGNVGEKEKDQLLIEKVGSHTLQTEESSRKYTLTDTSENVLFYIINELLVNGYLFIDDEGKNNKLVQSILAFKIEEDYLKNILSTSVLIIKDLSEILAFLFHDTLNSAKKGKAKRKSSIFFFKTRQRDIANFILSCISEPNKSQMNSFATQLNTAINLTDDQIIDSLKKETHSFNQVYSKISTQ